MPRSARWTLLVALVGVLWKTATAEGPKFKCPTVAPFYFPCTCEHGGDEGLFLRCENTNLASVAVGLANVRLPIQELRLYKCHIKKLHGDVFRSLLLKTLVLEDTPVSEVDDGVFKSVANSLTGLHILRAPLQQLPKNAISSLKNLEVSCSRGSD